MKKIIVYFILMIISLIIFVGCSNNGQDKLKEKAFAEVVYIENNVDDVLGDVLVKNDEKKWNEVSKYIENIYSTWGNLAVDLNKLGIADDELLAFANEINNVKLSISSKQEDTLIKSLSNLYSFMPKYLVICSDDSFEIVKKNIKYNIINSACTAKLEDWEEAYRYVSIAESEYLELMNNEEYAKRNQYNLNRVYIFLEELKKSVEIKNWEVFLLKYKVLIDEL